MNKTADTFGGLPFLFCWPVTDVTEENTTFSIGNYLPPT